MTVEELLKIQREFFHSNKTKTLNFRIDQLKKLKKVIKENEDIIIDALYKDLNKSKFEAFVTEIGILYDEINYAIKNLPKWIKSKKVKTPFVHFRAQSYIINEPYGNVLIISPWNYPFQLAIAPLIGAISGGNTAIIKPSEYSVHTSSVLEKIIMENFDPAYIACIQGDKDVTESLLKHPLDYIFFTGSVAVGKIIMERASKFLTPVTLELGGKSPAIVCYDADVALSAKRIVFGKLLNAGQTCVAPDYILVHRSLKDELINSIMHYIEEFYGKDILDNDTYPKMITKKHFTRLVEMLKDKNILVGGNYNESTLKVEPTLVDVELDDPLMTEEIFGPILPIIEYKHLTEAIQIVKERPKPLALYLFTSDADIEREIFDNISFGGGCVNDTIIHLATTELPFGGVGESGIGSYHGRASFDTFTHKKSILKKRAFDIKFRYPPFNEKKLNLVKKYFK